MKLNRSPIIALAVAVVALVLPASSAFAAEPAVSVTISSPSANSFHKSTPNLVFSTTGTGLLKTCSVTGPGVDIVDEGCSSNWNPGPLADGTYVLGIAVEKGSTGELAGASRTVTIDATAPVVTTGGSPAAGTSNGSVIQVTGSAADANPASFNCRIDENPWGNCVGNTASSGGFDLVNVAEGTHTYWFAATDKAGNVGVASRTITLDRTAPAVSITSTGWGNETKDNTPAFLVTATDATAVTKICSIEGVVSLAPQVCNGSTYVVADPIEDGTHAARLTATDGAGNTATATFTFTLDSTMPQITYGGVANDRTTDTAPSIEFWASDEHAVTTRCAFDAGAWEELADCAQGPDHKPAAPLALGAHSFWISATDSFGNVASAVYNFEVVAPGSETPGGQTPGGTGSNGAAVPRLSLVPKSSKVKRGRFTLSAAVTLTPAAGAATCDGSVVVTLMPKVKKAKAVKTTVKLRAKAGTCTGTAKFKLASKLKKKKAGIAVSFGGNTSMAKFTSTSLNVKL
ncbi:MAG: hypothetical protein JHC98_00885 [Thermoleophilaceae bacterium]|nr:hypothetical protein [Thermoleophilaceae bacterium]